MSGRLGRKKKTTTARAREGRPCVERKKPVKLTQVSRYETSGAGRTARKSKRTSTRNRMRHAASFELMWPTPYAIKPLKAPATEPAEMKRPTRFANSPFRYHKVK